jgi:hypothetical protein
MNSLRHFLNIVEANELINPKTNFSPAEFDYRALSRAQDEFFDKDPRAEHSGSFMKGQEVNPHEYEKQAFLPEKGDKDPMFLYYDATEDLRVQNPYVPVVYKTDIQYNKKGEQIPKYRMEQLVKWSGVPTTQLYLACTNVIKSVDPKSSALSRIKNFYKDQLFDKIHYSNLKDLSDLDDTDPDKNTLFGFGYACVGYALKAIEDVCRGAATTDDQLAEVCQIIAGIEKSYTMFSYDLFRGNLNQSNTNNVMFRRTSVGYQLVITDPLYLP